MILTASEWFSRGILSETNQRESNADKPVRWDSRSAIVVCRLRSDVVLWNSGRIRLRGSVQFSRPSSTNWASKVDVKAFDKEPRTKVLSLSQGI